MKSFTPARTDIVSVCIQEDERVFSNRIANTGHASGVDTGFRMINVIA